MGLGDGGGRQAGGEAGEAISSEFVGGAAVVVGGGVLGDGAKCEVLFGWRDGKEEGMRVLE
ncbi:hypothetical protein TIFTF001_014116 [Ficus carica]|uniref:Uncharacterized protein n=1 Tax=Ficus carica TaxID=3494 RepID=A0AA88DIE0_FICCA|nr:hypothetical protein TIFTF001_014116 [Ficus carica]